MAVSVIVQVECHVKLGSFIIGKYMPSQDHPGAILSLGVFGEGVDVSCCNTNTSLLKFLPVCYHNDKSKRREMALSEVNSGSIWAHADEVPPYPYSISPRYSWPRHLTPKLTGIYECTSPGLKPSVKKYQLEVVIAPRILNFTTSSSIVLVGDPVVIKCCAKGYPQPVFTINGHHMEALFDRLAGGVYESCATHKISTSDDVAETNTTATCKVELQQSVQCTTKANAYYYGQGWRSFPCPSRSSQHLYNGPPQTCSLKRQLTSSRPAPRTSAQAVHVMWMQIARMKSDHTGARVKAGFTGDGQSCSDILECSQTPPVCAHPARCIELPGSFSCMCPSGSTGERCSVTTTKRISRGGLVGGVVGGAMAVILGVVIVVMFFKRARKRTTQSDYNVLHDQTDQRDLMVAGGPWTLKLFSTLMHFVNWGTH